MKNDVAVRTGALLRRARRSRGVSQHALAVRLGTTQSAISRLETSGTVVPTIAFLVRVAAALDLTLVVAFADGAAATLAAAQDDPRIVADSWPSAQN